MGFNTTRRVDRTKTRLSRVPTNIKMSHTLHPFIGYPFLMLYLQESGESANEGGGDASDNPISRLAMARHAARARSPQYKVLEERGAARRREFVVQCDAPPHRATGLGPNKKTAKRRAAHSESRLTLLCTGTSVQVIEFLVQCGASQ